MRVAILASGSGSNFEVIANAFQNGSINGELVFVFSDRRKAFVHQRAEKLHVKSYAFSPKEFTDRAAYEAELLELLQKHEIDLIVLAGYLRMIGKTLLRHFPKRIINIHPSLLPSFPGLHGIEDAFSYGVKVTGVTIHYVDEGMDTGPIIAQKAVVIDRDETLESLTVKIHQAEHELYPKVLAEIIQKGVL